MRLQVEGLDQTGTKFRHLWGSYVIGFRPTTHCRNCFERHDETQVKPGTADGVYELEDTNELFSLCGVGFSDRGNTNVHLAVRPKPGSVAAVGSVYGVRFTIQNAQAIQIKHPLLLKSPPRGLAELEKDHIGCKNFQFGCQMFEVGEVGKSVEGLVVRTLRDGAHVRRTGMAAAGIHPSC